MRSALPKKFCREMESLLGDAYPAYIASLDEPECFGLRVNSRKISAAELADALPFSLTEVPWTDEGFYYEAGLQPAKDVYYGAGLYYLQEPSAMTPASRLHVQPGDLVLDLCAAPGGKSTKLGADLKGSGMLYANDISSSRAKALLKNLELFGIPNICVMSEEPRKLGVCYPEYFDKILIDAPCSGEGMFRREPKMIRAWEERGPESYVPIQRELLAEGYRMLKPGGSMLYSTCTFSKAENEENVHWLLQQCDDLKLLSIEAGPGFMPGVDGLSECVRLFPHKVSGEGHFLALLKKEEAPSGSQPESSSAVCGRQQLPRAAAAFLSEVTFNFEGWCFRELHGSLYALPPGFSPQPRLRYLRTGWYLGECRQNRFEPSQALAMGISGGDYPRIVNFDREDYRAVRYLKGETLNLEDFSCSEGWNLICVDGFPLGWGKVQRKTLKNKYYSGWRWQ